MSYEKNVFRGSWNTKAFKIPTNWIEQHIYGSSRLGVIKRDLDVDSLKVKSVNANLVGATYLLNFSRGNKLFELNNHLGNVLATVSDRKFGADTSSDGIVDYYTADVVNANDYYPFGMQMPNRGYSASGAYRYGFNGKENDNEVKGTGNEQDYGMRIYDPRLGRFLSTDPLTKSYPDLTPYQFGSNTPIWAIDLDGAEGMVSMPSENTSKIYVQAAKDVKSFVVEKHTQGMVNVKAAEQARQNAIRQGRLDGDGITWYTKAGVYIAPWFTATAPLTDANDVSVLFAGQNINGAKADFNDYVAASIGIFIPVVSGGEIKTFLKGFTPSLEGYKYGGKVFKDAEQFEKALVKAGSFEDRKAIIQTVLRDVADKNDWKKLSDLSKKTKREFYDLGNGTVASIDELHGHFEVFKNDGKKLTHQGSIDINGVKNKEANKDYDIKL